MKYDRSLNRKRPGKCRLIRPNLCVPAVSDDENTIRMHHDFAENMRKYDTGTEERMKTPISPVKTQQYNDAVSAVTWRQYMVRF